MKSCGSGIAGFCIAVICVVCGCSPSEKSDETPVAIISDDTGLATEDSVLSGKIYELSDSVNASCDRVLPGTDYWPTYVFLNDSAFISVIHNCCMPATETFFTGKYRLKNDQLLLFYDSLSLRYEYGLGKDSALEIYEDQKDTMELLGTGCFRERLIRFNCGKYPFFRQTAGSWSGQYIAFSEDSAIAFVSRMKKKSVWSRLKL